MFKMDNELKMEYLNEKPTKTAKSDAFVLRLADEYEELINKSLYNMSYSELNQLLAWKFKNSTSKAISKNISVLKTYVDFCIDKNMVVHGENRFAAFTLEDFSNFINKQAVKMRFLTKEELENSKNILYNAQDKLLLELLFTGIKGRPTQEGTLEEIINLRWRDVDEGNRTIILTQNDGKHRILEDVPASTIGMIKDAYNQEYYTENNGKMTNNLRLSAPKDFLINHVEDYVLRIPGKNRYLRFGTSLLNSRLRKIQKYLDNHYITYISLYMSGMFNMLLEIQHEKGELTKDDYLVVCNRFNYAFNEDNGEGRYWSILRTSYNEFLEVKGLQ